MSGTTSETGEGINMGEVVRRRDVVRYMYEELGKQQLSLPFPSPCSFPRDPPSMGFSVSLHADNLCQRGSAVAIQVSLALPDWVF